MNNSSCPEEAGEAGAQPDLPENPASPGGARLAPHPREGQHRPSPQNEQGCSCPKDVTDLVCHPRQRVHSQTLPRLAAAATRKVGKAQLNRVLSVVSLQPSPRRAHLQEAGFWGPVDPPGGQHLPCRVLHTALMNTGQ